MTPTVHESVGSKPRLIRRPRVPSVGQRLGKNKITIRVIDQGAWSGAFFLFNLLAAMALSVDWFAALSAVTAACFIIIAACRAVALNARVISGAQHGLSASESVSPKFAFLVFFAGACVAGLVGLVVGCDTAYSSDGIGFIASIVLLPALMTFADGPRQVLLLRNYPIQSAVVAGLYVAGGGILATIAILAIGVDAKYSAIAAIGGWCLVLAVVAAVGSGLVVRRDRSRKQERVTGGPYYWRLGLESVYIGLGGQAAVFILYLSGDSSATEGIRLAYSLVFAPAFLVVQAVSPMYLRFLSHRHLRDGAVSPQFLALFMVGASTVFVFSGIAGMIAANIWPEFRGLSAAVAFILPVGLSVASNQVLELGITALRFNLHPKVLLRARFGLVGIDLAAQVIGMLAWGVTGLCGALVAISIVRAALCGGIIIRLRAGDAVRGES